MLAWPIWQGLVIDFSIVTNSSRTALLRIHGMYCIYCMHVATLKYKARSNFENVREVYPISGLKLSHTFITGNYDTL